MKQKLYLAAALLTAFLIWTMAVCLVDVAPIGPQDSTVGFSRINGAFHRLTGVQLSLYYITDWLSLVPLGFVMGFALLAFVQWVRRRSLRKVDRSILVLGGFYGLTMASFLFFELVAINYRPVLIEGVLEASYPSSTTLLVLCVMPTAVMQLNRRVKNCRLRKLLICSLTVFSAFMVVGRVLSGVHWLSDIIGGLLLSAGLVLLYAAAIKKADP